MPSPIQASTVLANAAALMNDAAQTKFTNNALLPYLKLAYKELQEHCEENNVSITNELSAILPVTTSMFDIGGNTGPALPADLVEIQTLLERTTGTAEDFVEMTQVEYLPPFAGQVRTEALIYWAWQNQIIQLLGATTNRDVQIQYIGLTLGSISGANSNINLFQAELFLSFRTAFYAANFVGEDSDRATKLETMGEDAKERLMNINTKSKQSITTRRRPFMATFKVNRSL